MFKIVENVMATRQEYQKNYYANNKMAKQREQEYKNIIVSLKAEILMKNFEIDIQMKRYEKLLEENERLKLAHEYFARGEWQQI